MEILMKPSAIFYQQRNPEISHILNNPDLMRQVHVCLVIKLQQHVFHIPQICSLYCSLV